MQTDNYSFHDLVGLLDRKAEGSTAKKNRDYIVGEFAADKLPPALSGPFKLNAALLLFCTSGQARLRINLKEAFVQKGNVVIINPNNTIELLRNADGEPPFNGFALYLSPELINGITIESATINYSGVQFSSPSVWHLEEPYCAIFCDYLRLLGKNYDVPHRSDVHYRNITRSLIAAMVYHLFEFRSITHVANATDPSALSSDTTDDFTFGQTAVQRAERHATDNQGRNRRAYYIRNFLNLVAKHFKEHRTIAFYAESLFISPKYLSMIIKESTGHTATEWIDHYVVLEAKNQLRFSGRNIQQIADDLNFHNQSSFGKYFKHQTGQSPSEFRKT